MENGRGAWSSKGIGGTLKPSRGKTIPGPYYMLAENDIDQIGLGTWCRRAQGLPVNQDYNATFHGVVGIQLLLNSYVGANLEGDGIFGPTTKWYTVVAQKKAGLVEDGVIGIKTMKALLLPLIQRTAAKFNEPWEPIYGVLRFEGALDPGAVGYIDPQDWGLAQINTKYHPEVSFAQAFCPSYATAFVANYLRYGLDSLDGNLRDAVVSYNLGIGGARQWIRAGRPDVWTPVGSDLERKPNEYIDRILNAHRDN